MLDAVAKSLGVTEFKKLKVFRSWREIFNEAIILLENMNTETYIASRFFQTVDLPTGLASNLQKMQNPRSTQREAPTRAPVSRLTRKTVLTPKVTRIFTRIVEYPLITLKGVGSL